MLSTDRVSRHSVRTGSTDNASSPYSVNRALKSSRSRDRKRRLAQPPTRALRGASAARLARLFYVYALQLTLLETLERETLYWHRLTEYMRDTSNGSSRWWWDVERLNESRRARVCSTRARQPAKRTEKAARRCLTMVPVSGCSGGWLTTAIARRWRLGCRGLRRPRQRATRRAAQRRHPRHVGASARAPRPLP
jgi:hypothetical protein